MAGHFGDSKRDVCWIEQHPSEALSEFANEGLLWITGCSDKNLCGTAAAQVDEHLIDALALVSDDSPSARQEHARWSGDIRATRHGAASKALRRAIVRAICPQGLVSMKLK